MAPTISQVHSPFILSSFSSPYNNAYLKYLTSPVLLSTMKFEDYLMQQSDDKNTRLDLHDEVENLKSVLEEEQAINKIQGLLAELAMVEEEIIWLERKVDELKRSLYKERKLQKKLQIKPRQLPPPSGLVNGSVFSEDSNQLSKSQHYQDTKKEKIRFRRASVGSAQGMSHIFSTGSTSKILFSPSKDSL